MNVSRTEFLQEVKEKVAYCIVRRRGYVKGGGDKPRAARAERID